jgi:hypothetical protein
MTGLKQLARDCTDWRAFPPSVFAPGVFALDAETTTGGTTRAAPSVLAEPQHLIWIAFACSGCGAAQGDLLRKAWLDALTAQVTTAPIVRLFVDGSDPRASPSAGRAFDPAPVTTPAQRMAAELRSVSGLTNEEIGPLVGVSRRSLQAWIAGESISARNEIRLRAVLDAVRALAADTREATRDRLFQRPTLHAVRPYDLVAEQRYDAAVDLVLTRSPRAAAATTRTAEPLNVQLGRIDEPIAPPPPRVDRRLSRPLRR